MTLREWWLRLSSKKKQHGFFLSLEREGATYIRSAPIKSRLCSSWRPPGAGKVANAGTARKPADRLWILIYVDVGRLFSMGESASTKVRATNHGFRATGGSVTTTITPGAQDTPKLPQFGPKSVVAAIEAVKAGKIIVVTDDEDRENEGDLIMAAEFATPETIGFIRRYSSGVICVAVRRRT